MGLRNASIGIFNQLRTVLNDLPEADYRRSLDILSGSSVGQHVRHILEFYQCLAEGYNSAEVNYDVRKRNLEMEQSPIYSIQKLETFESFVKSADSRKALVLFYSYDEKEVQEVQSIITSLDRELLYNLEHAIHHMAILKIGIKSIHPDFMFPENFGVASSTVRHQQHVHSKLSAS
jgi:hypothetical protein